MHIATLELKHTVSPSKNPKYKIMIHGLPSYEGGIVIGDHPELSRTGQGSLLAEGSLTEPNSSVFALTTKYLNELVQHCGYVIVSVNSISSDEAEYCCRDIYTLQSKGGNIYG